MVDDLSHSEPTSSLERWVKALSVVAIPVVLGIGSWFIQRAIARQELNRDYVTLAVSVINDSSVVYPDLRDWAVDLLARYSPTPISDSTKARLKRGDYGVLGGSGSRPPAVLTDTGDTSEAPAPGWYTILGTFALDDTNGAFLRARTLSDSVNSDGLPLDRAFSIMIYQTRISRSYAVTLGGARPRGQAIEYAGRIRSFGWVPDAFAQIERGWTLYDSIVPSNPTDL